MAWVKYRCVLRPAFLWAIFVFMLSVFSPLENADSRARKHLVDSKKVESVIP